MKHLIIIIFLAINFKKATSAKEKTVRMLKGMTVVEAESILGIDMHRWRTLCDVCLRFGGRSASVSTDGCVGTQGQLCMMLKC